LEEGEGASRCGLGRFIKNKKNTKSQYAWGLTGLKKSKRERGRGIWWPCHGAKPWARPKKKTYKGRFLQKKPALTMSAARRITFIREGGNESDLKASLFFRRPGVTHDLSKQLQAKRGNRN